MILRVNRYEKKHKNSNILYSFCGSMGRGVCNKIFVMMINIIIINY